MGTVAHDQDGRRFRPVYAREPAGNLAEVSARAVREVESRHAEQLGYLVWSEERLRELGRAVDEVLDALGVEAAVQPLVRRSVLNQLTGLGALDTLLLDDRITEIMVNRADEVVVERDGRLERVPSVFVDEAEVYALAQRLAARAGRSLNTEQPMADARLSDGSRISVILPPVSRFPALAIRRAAERPPSIQDLVASGAVTPDAWAFLTESVQARANVVVAGGAGAGKTHLLRLLTTAIPADERLVVIEDVRELDLDRSGVVALESSGRYSTHDLVVQALRMRPDRILVGEVRAQEALDLIEAMATGHPGSFTTVHSPGPGMDTVHRLARAALRSGTALSFEVLCQQILRAVDVIVFVERTGTGQRRVAEVDLIVDGTPRPHFVRGSDGRLGRLSS
jgi:pilus assembly protein CpaF